MSTQVEPPFEYLNYTIRFQNTGNAAAENVVITDILDSRFDKNSFELVSASHPHVSRLTGNKLEVIFEGINLPDSIADEPQSHGYVAFKVKPKSGSVNAGDNIKNTANIYFDYNLPIVTNTVSTFYYNVLEIGKFDIQNEMTLYPNPTKNVITVSISDKTIKSTSIYNMLGQLLQKTSNQAMTKTITVDVSELKIGTYFIEIVSDKGKTTKKFVKH